MKPTKKELKTVSDFLKLINSDKTSKIFKSDKNATIYHTYREVKELNDFLNSNN